VTADDDHPFYDETSYALSLKGFQKKPLVIAEVGNFTGWMTLLYHPTNSVKGVTG